MFYIEFSILDQFDNFDILAFCSDFQKLWGFRDFNSRLIFILKALLELPKQTTTLPRPALCYLKIRKIGATLTHAWHVHVFVRARQMPSSILTWIFDVDADC